ncbi:MAG: thiamine pyrophosphate-dependent enzyme [Endomicrobiaceae bacterium]|nr:thiamine pyrophosphate-dependent enzyme [Endomicrobiaceae bacterium]MDD3923252.1 thiamine pyrophosphate-dependent enzyme [Endomicrobiaceae bacterium]
MNTKNYKLLSGNEALAQGAYEAGLKFAGSYPGTPATEILEYLTQFDEVDAQWAVNEKVAFEVALGASFAGVRSIYSSKHVGINVAMDPLMTAAYSGINAGFVIVTADDPGLHSSQNEQDNRLISKFAKIPLLEPSSPSEAKKFIKLAFEISEQFDTPVLFRMTTRVAHTKENIEIGQRQSIENKVFEKNPQKYVMVPANAYKKHILLEEKLLKLQDYSEKSDTNIIEIKDKELGFVADSVSYLYVKETYPGASILKLGMPFPFPDNKIKEFAAQVKKIVVVEENEPFIEEHLLQMGIKCTGKHYTYRVGELRPENIRDIVENKPKTQYPSGSRRPVLCAGCPHRAVFVALRKTKVIVSGDIGCYTLGSLPPLAALHTTICMGASVTIFDSLSKVLGSDKVVAVIGDSTFVHSGITGLINAAYNKAKGLIIILDNGTTAMTGAQPNPSTGMTAKNEQTKKLDLEALCKACGADNVEVIDSSCKSIEYKIKEYTIQDKLSVLIVRYALCKMIDRTKKPAPLFHAEKCKKCYMCISVDCPSIVKDEQGNIKLNSNLCAGCNVCVEMCKFGALEKNK